MPIDIHQINVSPLATLAGNSVGNLGLDPYGVDVGAAAKGQAEGYWKAQDLQEKYAQQATLMKIKQLEEAGALTRNEATNMTNAALEKFKQQNANMRAAATNEIQQQNADTQRMGIGVQQQNADTNRANVGSQMDYRNAKIGLEGQSVAQQGAFQQGSLNIAQQNADTNKQEAMQQALQKHFENALTMQDRDLAGQGRLHSGILAAVSLKDPQKQQTAIAKVIELANKQGIDTSEYAKANSPQEISMIAMAGAGIAYNAEKARAKATDAGKQFVMGEDGTVSVQPLNNKPSSIDKEISKQMAIQYKEAGDAEKKADLLVNSAKDALAQLKTVPEDMLGPISGLYAKYTNKDVQVLEGKLNAITLQMKEAYNMGSQGFTTADRKFIQEIAGKITSFKGTTAELLKGIQQAAEHSKTAAWIDQYNQIKNSPEHKDQWLADHPSPTVYVQFKDDKGNLTGDKKPIKASDLTVVNQRGWEQVNE